MQNSSRDIVTLMLLQEERDDLVAKFKALRKEVVAMENAISHIDLAMLSIKSSPLTKSIEAHTSHKGLLSRNYEMPIRPGVVARLVDTLRGNHAE